MLGYIERLKETQELDVKDLAARYSTENVVSYALGVEAKTFENDNSEFRQMSFQIFEGSTLQSLMAYIAMVFPFFIKYLKIRYVGKQIPDVVT